MTQVFAHARGQQQSFYLNLRQLSLIVNDNDNLYLNYTVKSNEYIFET